MSSFLRPISAQRLLSAPDAPAEPLNRIPKGSVPPEDAPPIVRLGVPKGWAQTAEQGLARHLGVSLDPNTPEGRLEDGAPWQVKRFEMERVQLSSLDGAARFAYFTRKEIANPPLLVAVVPDRADEPVRWQNVRY